MTMRIAKAEEAPRRRVLFVEDHPDLLAMYERSFAHHECVLVNNAEHALYVMERNRDFHLVVCDLVLPGMTGLELYHKVHSFAPELARRFVFATAEATREQFRSLELIDIPIIEKPFGMRVLRELLDRTG